MTRVVLAVALLVVLAPLSRAGEIYPDPPATLDEVNREGKLLVEFCSDWCPWWAKVDKTFEQPAAKTTVHKSFHRVTMHPQSFGGHQECLGESGAERISRPTALSLGGSTNWTAGRCMDAKGLPVFLAQAAEEEGGQGEGPAEEGGEAGAMPENAAEGAHGLETVDLAYLTRYLDRMGLKYEANHEKGFARLVMVGDHGKYDTYVIANVDTALAFIVISNYMTVRSDHRNCDKVLRRLMELNWKLNVGKFEWDPTDGEVRLTFTFSTENGVGYEAFTAVFETLTATADEYKEDLERLLVGD